MSVAGISSSLVDFQSSGAQNSALTKRQQFKQDFEQLGQDVQSGNLTAAKADLSSIQSLTPSGHNSAAFNASKVGQAFNQLAQDVQSGNVAGAQQDYSSLQSDIQTRLAQVRAHHHHHGSGVSDPPVQQNPISQTVGAAPQSGTVSPSQQAYSAYAAGSSIA